MYICPEREGMETKKRLVAEIPPEIHKEIKIQAAFGNMTMRKWVIRAIIEKIQRDKKYQ
jgi:predicted HicB family RNase H-like nuclease